MTQKQDPLMTQDKYDELERELAKLYERRKPAALEVSRLAELGDFSENVEYQLAKGRLRGINNRILVVEEQLKRAEIIKPLNTDSVQIGSTVKVGVHGVESTYTILGSAETNPAAGVISHTSPIGAALLGHRVGETVIIETKRGTTEYTILKID